MKTQKIAKACAGALLAWGGCTVALAQATSPSVNHGVVGWFLNKPDHTYKPSGYVPYPQDADASPPQYDTALILPASLTLSGLTTAGGTPTLLNLVGLSNPVVAPALPSTYVSFPFKTGPQNDADILINQATYSLNNNTLGQNFNVTTTLVDVGGGGAEYPVSQNVDFGSVYDPSFLGFYFINNQQWPMVASTPNFPAAAYYKFPVPLKPNHQYELRTYLAKNTVDDDGKGMMDDLTISMQAVTVNAVDDVNVDFQAQTGGTTASVLANDTILGVATTATNYVVTPKETLPAGVTLHPDGRIEVAPGQPQTYTISYQLCPDYGTNLFGTSFVSNACKTAKAQVSLIGAPPPPTVSISCTPSVLVDSAGSVATCTITADTVVTNPLTVQITPPTGSSRYQTTCTNPQTIAGGADSTSCTITATPNAVPGDGTVNASMSLLADSAYVIGTGTATVAVQDDDVPLLVDGRVVGGPATLPANLVGQTVSLTLHCTPDPAAPETVVLTIAADGMLSMTAPSSTYATSTCNPALAESMPTLPAPPGYQWLPSVVLPAAGNSNFHVTLTLSRVAAAPTPVPVLGQLALVLLGLFTAAVGAVRLRNMRV